MDSELGAIKSDCNVTEVTVKHSVELPNTFVKALQKHGITNDMIECKVDVNMGIITLITSYVKEYEEDSRQ